MVRSLLVFAGILLATAAEPAPAPAPAPAMTAEQMKGQACTHCHDDVHQGTVGTACEGCHTTTTWTPSTFLASRHAETKFALTGAHVDAACNQCHPNGKLVGQPLECAGCHLDRHRGKLGEACADCHTTTAFSPVEGFDHTAKTGFALTGTHAPPVACDDCHAGARGRNLLVDPEPSCATCHLATHGDFGPCEECHGAAQEKVGGTFASGRFDHRETAFALERRHSALPCASCHPVDADAPLSSRRASASLSPSREARSDCQSCHVDVHSGQLSAVCSDCHRPDRWRVVRFDHDLSTFPLRGAHFVTPCTSCHSSERWIGLPRDCWACHSGEAARGPSTIPAHTTGIADCADCHGSWTW